MVSKTVIFKNLTGLHLRPAGILQVLSAGVRYGDEVSFVCDGEDEEKALERIVRVVEEMLNE